MIEKQWKMGWRYDQQSKDYRDKDKHQVDQGKAL